MSDENIRNIATNRKARHDYHIEESYEAGLVLTGSEIKSVREGQVNLRDSYTIVRRDELWLLNMHIAPYKQATHENHEPRRPRKLLLHRRQINRLIGKLQEKGITLVPLRLYLKNNWAKVELGVARGKREYDKRQTLRHRDDQRRIEQALARRRRERR